MPPSSHHLAPTMRRNESNFATRSSADDQNNRDAAAWTRIAQTAHQVVLYHPPANIVSVRRRSSIMRLEGSGRMLSPPVAIRADTHESAIGGLGLVRRQSQLHSTPSPFPLRVPETIQDGLMTYDSAASPTLERRVVISHAHGNSNGGGQMSPSLALSRRSMPGAVFQDEFSAPVAPDDISHDTAICPYCTQFLPQGWTYPTASRAGDGSARRSTGYDGGKRDRRRRDSMPASASFGRRPSEAAEGYFPGIRGIVEDSRGGLEAPNDSALTDDDDTYDTDGRFVDLSHADTVGDDIQTAQSSTGPPMLYARPYFRILEQAAEGESGRSSPAPEAAVQQDAAASGSSNMPRQTADIDGKQRIASESTSGRTADGYYRRFFIEERRLGMGAEGSVFLCQHVLDGHQLGRYAVKKVAVGDSRPYLDRVLREVRLLENLRHPNIIPYHHVWIEDAQFSR